MKISGFTIARNIQKYRYPFTQSVRSILPLCDEFIINVGDSEDDTAGLVASIKSDKIRVIDSRWDMSMGKEVLSYETNRALQECRGDWAFYLQADEVIHENDWRRIQRVARSALSRPVDALRFRWLHFYGSYYRYRVDAGWYQKQSRMIRNNGEVVSVGDAYSFARKDGSSLREEKTGCFLYHYGWVQTAETLCLRRKNAIDLGFAWADERVRDGFDFGGLERFPVYYGSHPAVMAPLVAGHELSRQDWAEICRRRWWHPYVYLRPRVKTWKRVKNRIDDTLKNGSV